MFFLTKMVTFTLPLQYKEYSMMYCTGNHIQNPSNKEEEQSVTQTSKERLKSAHSTRITSLTLPKIY